MSWKSYCPYAMQTDSTLGPNDMHRTGSQVKTDHIFWVLLSVD